MAMAENIVDMREVMNRVTMKVEIKLKHGREMKRRAWLGTKLLILAAWVMGCGIKFEPMPWEPPVHFNAKCELIRDE
jgi:hypothetical protein